MVARFNQSRYIRTACIICTRTPQHTGVSSNLNVLVQIGLYLNPRFAETYANLCEYVHLTHSLVFRCLHTQHQRNCTQLHEWLIETNRHGKQIKSATSACCLLRLPPAELEGKALGDGGGHAVLQERKWLAVCTKGRDGRFHRET